MQVRVTAVPTGGAQGPPSQLLGDWKVCWSLEVLRSGVLDDLFNGLLDAAGAAAADRSDAAAHSSKALADHCQWHAAMATGGLKVVVMRRAGRGL